MTHTVLITVNFFDEAAVALLASRGCRTVEARMLPGLRDGDLSQPDLLDLGKDADAWIVGTSKVTRQLLEHLPKLQIIARRGVGYDRVDLEAARELGRVVTISPGGNEEAVADHAVMLMLAVGRSVCEFSQSMRTGNWTVKVGTGLHGKTVGILGFGQIGRAVAKRLEGFNAQILAYDERIDPEYAESHHIKFASLNETLTQSDYVTLHLPLNPGTQHVIGSDAFRRMKPGAILVNTARGGLVDERALLRALDSGHLAGAGLDVFEVETDERQKETATELCLRPNVVATPHVAGFTADALNRANHIAAEAVLAVFSGGSLPSSWVVADGRK